MTTSPQLSVIIPTYNRAALLRRTIESVFNQTFSDYEIIVVDDGSTDRTEDLIATLLKDKHEKAARVRYFYQHNQGKSVALNKALSEARGEWIAFLDSDDLWLPHKIEEQFHALARFAPRTEACFTDARFINNPALQTTGFARAGKRYTERYGRITDPIRLMVHPPHGVHIVTLLLSLRAIQKVGEFDPTLRVSEDTDFLFRLAMHTQFCYVNTPLALIDRTPVRAEGLTEVLMHRDIEYLDIRERMFSKWLRLSSSFDNDVNKAIRSHLSGIYSARGNWLLKARRYREVLTTLSTAARVQLTLGIAAKFCLTAIAPPLARRIVIHRERRYPQQAFPIA